MVHRIAALVLTALILGTQTGMTVSAAVQIIPAETAGPDASYGPGVVTAPAPEEKESEETLTPEESKPEESVPEQKPEQNPNAPCLQVQLMRPDQTWTDPIRNDTEIKVGEDGFLSVCIYMINMPGDVLYRTYASQRGWSRWAMNGEHCDWNNDKVEAVQIRLNGPFGNTYDVYYTSTLSDGSKTGWSRNGETNGAMANGRYITGLRFSTWNKGTDFPYNRENRVSAVAEDGIVFGEGLPVFSNGTGEAYTGWAWNDRDRYYFVNSAAVTGWQYIDGYKYYFDEGGKLVTDLEPYLGSEGPFILKINKQMNCTTVYAKDGENGYIIPFKSFLCSTGDDTPLGTFKTPEKYRWRLMNTDEYCQYCTRLGSGLSILMHSVIYEKPNPRTLKPDTYNYLGANKSHGCIRFTTEDAKWIYDHCPLGTSITVYESPIVGPFDRPALDAVIPADQNWDPTDVSVTG